MKSQLKFQFELFQNTFFRTPVSGCSQNEGKYAVENTTYWLLFQQQTFTILQIRLGIFTSKMYIIYDPVIYGSDSSSIALIIQLLCDVTFANTLYFLLCFWFLSHSFFTSELATPMENQRFSKSANEIDQCYTLNIQQISSNLN